MGIDANFIEKIEDLARPEFIEVEGKSYVLPQYNKVLPEMARAIEVDTLQSFLDYIKKNPDGVNMDECFVHIHDHRRVDLITPMDEEWRKRETLISAECNAPEFNYGTWHDPEEMIINMNVGFERLGDYEYILKLISGLTRQSKEELSDNGISQSTVVKKDFGGMVENTEIKNPVELYPFRTFQNLQQPKILSLFRIQKDSGSLALFEVGSSWKLEAIAKIKEWLIENDCPLTILA